MIHVLMRDNRVIVSSTGATFSVDENGHLHIHDTKGKRVSTCASGSWSSAFEPHPAAQGLDVYARMFHAHAGSDAAISWFNENGVDPDSVDLDHAYIVKHPDSYVLYWRPVINDSTSASNGYVLGPWRQRQDVTRPAFMEQ